MQRPIAPDVSLYTEQEASKETLLKQVDGLRAQSRRARRLAESLTEGPDRATLLAMAKELDEQADRFEGASTPKAWS